MGKIKARAPAFPPPHTYIDIAPPQIRIGFPRNRYSNDKDVSGLDGLGYRCCVECGRVRQLDAPLQSFCCKDGHLSLFYAMGGWLRRPAGTCEHATLARHPSHAAARSGHPRAAAGSGHAEGASLAAQKHVNKCDYAENRAADSEQRRAFLIAKPKKEMKQNQPLSAQTLGCDSRASCHSQTISNKIKPIVAQAQTATA